jgi:hypothetical protein
VYVDEHGDDTSTTDTHGGEDQLTVEVDGESFEVAENYDFDEDGENDTAVVETEDGYIAFADTNHDGTADVAVEFDHDGNVVSGAEYDESAHEWREEDVNSLPTPAGGGADDGGSAHDKDSDQDKDGSDAPAKPRGGDDQTEQTGHHTGGSGSGGEDITVHTRSGEFDAGKAEYDSDGDGTKDTAVVTDKDGTTYAFTDTDGDGEADEAVVIEADGDVTVAHNTGGDEWETTQHGHIDAQGEFHPDSGSSGSDSVWAESSR